MEVFSESYIDKQQQRWGTRKERDWPLVTKIALQQHRTDDRDRIEMYVSALHPDDRQRIANQLRNENQFITAYGELIVGRILISAGLTPRYEPRIETLSGYVTPDWYVEGSSPLVCDVFTAGLEKIRDADETALRELEDRLSDGTTGCMIGIELPNAAAIDAGQRKRLAAEVHEWLASTPRIGSRKAFASLTVELMAIGGGRLDVVTIDPMHMVVTPESIADNFDAKVKKYGFLGFPLLVAAVKHHRAQIDVTDIEDVLRGSLAYVSGQTASGRIIGKTTRLADGVFEKRPSLSGAIYVEPHKSPAPTIRTWLNPSATAELAADAFARLNAARL
jgi:hypothetical protein